MDLRTRTSLFCGALAIAIAISILLRGRPRKPQIWFAAFALDIGLWYLAQWLYHVVRAEVWVRFTAILAVLLPQFALRLFEALMPELERRSTLQRIAGVSLVPTAAIALFVPVDYFWVRGLVFAYLFGLLAAGLWSLYARAERSRSRVTRRRVTFLVLVGASAMAATLADFLWFVGFEIPPIGAVLAILFLFVLSESLIRQRFVDAYDVLGQVTLAAVLASCLAGIFYVFVVLFGGFDTMYLGAFLATMVILVLFEPLREKANRALHATLFRERVDLERAFAQIRPQLGHVLRLEQIAPIVLGPLEASRRATGAALYLRDPTGSHFALAGHFGPPAPPRIDPAAARPLLDRLTKRASIVLEEVARDADVSQPRTRETDAAQRLLSASEVLGPFRTGVCVGLRTEQDELLGLLVVTDDRASDAYSPDEIQILESLGVQAATTVGNTRQYQKLQARDRLAVLGQMAAGLAHEVKNPLGAIKGAAQLLNDPQAALNAGDREFVGIILEEVDRLDRVVGSVLDYARPPKGNPGEVDVNSVIERTLTILAPEAPGCEFVTDLGKWLPPVQADAEQLRQVLINLVRNAVQAMGGTGKVTVTSRNRSLSPSPGFTAVGSDPSWVEITVKDEGPGLDSAVLDSLFVPFVTTKERGTGLGLAISQRIVGEMGGRIEVTSNAGQGAAFTVLLPSGAGAATPTAPHASTELAPEASATQATSPDDGETPTSDTKQHAS